MIKEKYENKTAKVALETKEGDVNFLWVANFPDDELGALYDKMKADGKSTDEIAKTLFTVTRVEDKTETK